MSEASWFIYMYCEYIRRNLFHIGNKHIFDFLIERQACFKIKEFERLFGTDIVIETQRSRSTIWHYDLTLERIDMTLSRGMQLVVNYDSLFSPGSENYRQNRESVPLVYTFKRNSLTERLLLCYLTDKF